MNICEFNVVVAEVHEKYVNVECIHAQVFGFKVHVVLPEETA